MSTNQPSAGGQAPEPAAPATFGAARNTQRRSKRASVNTVDMIVRQSSTQQGTLPNKSTEMKQPHTLTSLSQLQEILSFMPNYKLFHNIVIYGNHSMGILEDEVQCEDSVFDVQRSMYHKNTSVGAQSFYAPDERVCSVSKYSVDTDSMRKCINGLCRGMACTNGEVDAQQRGMSIQLMHAFHKQVENSCDFISRHVDGSSNRPPDAIDLVSAPLECAFDWCIAVLKWTDAQYIKYSSTGGLVPFAQCKTQAKNNTDIFEARVSSLAVFRIASIAQHVAGIQKAKESVSSTPNGCAGGKGTTKHDNARNLELIMAAIIVSWRTISVLSVDAVNRCIWFYLPWINKNGLSYVRQCLDSQPESMRCNDKDVGRVLRCVCMYVPLCSPTPLYKQERGQRCSAERERDNLFYYTKHWLHAQPMRLHLCVYEWTYFP
jgi:hypothetical protein